MPRQQGLWGEEWDICDRCGFKHPISMLSMQLGLKLCHDHGCYDDISNMRRLYIITEILKKPEGTSDKGIVLQGPGEVVF